MLDMYAPPLEAFCEGTVQGVEPDACQVVVDGALLSVTVAVPRFRPAVGDRVLVAQQNSGRGWIVGVVGCADGSESTDGELKSDSGHTVQLQRDGQGERIELRDPQSRLLMRFDLETGHAELSAPGGDLRLAAPSGHIELVAGRGVKCVGSESVVLRAGGEGSSSSLRLSRREAALCGERLDIAAKEAEIHLDRTSYTGTRLEAKLGRARWFIGRLETTVHRLVERLKNVYRSVEGVQQVRAGRMRTLVRGSHHLKANSCVIRTDDDLKLDGRRIHLG